MRMTPSYQPCPPFRSRRRSEHPLLLLQRAERSDVRHRESYAKLILIARAEIESAVLHADAAAIRVIGHLRGGELHGPDTEIIYGCECGVPTPMIRVAEPERAAKLTCIRGKLRNAAHLSVA